MGETVNHVPGPYPDRIPEGYNLAPFDGRSYVEEGVFMGLEVIRAET